MSQAPRQEDERDRLDEIAELLGRAKPPPADPALRQRQIRAAIADAAEPERRPFGQWALGLSGVAVALLAAIVLIWPNATPEGGARLLSGAIASSASGYGKKGDLLNVEELLRVPAMQRALIGLDDGSQVELDALSEVRILRQKGWSIQLARGRARVRAARQRLGGRLRVATPEAMTQVVGTRFEVTRDPRRGTTVRVSEGKVEVWPSKEAKRELVEGPDGVLFVNLAGKIERATSALAPSASAAAADAGRPADRGVDAGQPVREKPAVSHIRRQIRGGRIKRARALIRRGRRVARGRRHYLAELMIVEAEADLAEKRYRRAIRGYLYVSGYYRGTPQAEAALFAAGQIALDHDRGRAATLLGRYQRRYPRGRFAKDAARLLKLLEGAD